MELGFTPAVYSTDFALIISPLDGAPADVPEPLADMTALYLDFKWIGNFPPGTGPDDSSYYAGAPTFTFALSEEWADSERVERDDNGVPEITLNLFDESEDEWLAVSGVDVPTGAVDGEYVYGRTSSTFQPT